MIRLLAVLLALSASTALAADPVAIANLSFRQSDAGSGKPTGWTQFGGNYDVHTECTTTCALHLQSRDGAGEGDGVYQQVAAGSAAGHRLVLSGRIRTEHTEGNAFLAVRVLGDAGTIGDYANGPAVPNGTADWKRFEVVAPVPANATGLVIGAALRGKGSAWIDSLELKIDDSATATASVPKPPVSPPRPVPSQQLLDDAALRIAEADMPSIPPEVRSDVLARRHPIRSLFSDDFSDLQFLKPLLKGKRLVQLGEASHSVAESNWAKVRLIKFLHQEMGFDVIAFESSFDQCHDADKEIGTLAPQQVMGQCLFSIWQTREVLGLFEYMASVRKSARPLTLAGFDIQFSGNRSDKSRLRGMLAVADASLLSRLDDDEKELHASTTLTAQRSASIQARYEAIAKALGERRAELRAAGYVSADIDMEIGAAHGRAWLARRNEHLEVANSMPGNAVRDEGMAEQLNYVLDTLYPRHKVIVWAHNMHITNAHAPDAFISMGERLAQRRRGEMYTVGFYMGRGVSASMGMQYAIAAPPSNTVEAVLANGGLKYTFVDFSKAAPGPSTTWFTGKNTVREWGTVPTEIVPAQSYDAIFYIDTVTLAENY